MILILAKAIQKTLPLAFLLAVIYAQLTGQIPTRANRSITVDETSSIAPIYKNYSVSNASLHGVPGWEGVDIYAGCGKPVLSPISGIVAFNGLDGYNQVDERGVVREQTPMITIKNDRYTVTIMHGNYTAPIGTRVVTGEQVGTEGSQGMSTGCHSHVVVKENGKLKNYLDILNNPETKANYPLRISHYDPSLGGINCDHDCSTMASGDSVSEWVNGKNGVYAAACPRSNGWHIGKRFSIDGITYECRDTGGWINCYQPGQTDIAIRNAHASGYMKDVPEVAGMFYCWVDLMHDESYPYGQFVWHWKQ